MANLRPNPEYIMPKSKAQVEYKQTQACKFCDYFYTTGRCGLVEGNISPDGICTLWEPMGRKSPYLDKDFFQNEFRKSQEK